MQTKKLKELRLRRAMKSSKTPSKQRVEIDYPVEAHFYVERDEAPVDSKYGCEARTKALHKFLRSRKTGPLLDHMVDDYIVEEVHAKGRSEVWVVGS